jgi:Trypsin-like peptidase domain
MSAVFEGDEKGVTNHLGTGSIIGDGTIVLTADHVIRGVTGRLGFAVIIGGDVEVFLLTVLQSDADRDLALLRIHGYQAPNPLHVVFDANVSYNSDLVVLEYAQTEYTEAGQFLLNPAGRRGHKTRNVNAKELGAIAGVHALELSFPALRGASGAPVLFESTPFVADELKWGIVGVLVANHDYHAIPAQTITYVGDDASYIEERHYMLPQGLAVDINHLKPMYERVISDGSGLP